MKMRRTIERTCDRCHGRKDDGASLSPLKSFLKINYALVMISLIFDRSGISFSIILGCAIIGSIVLLALSKRLSGCKACAGRGYTKVVETTTENQIDDKEPFKDEILFDN